jgi:HPt (histidine-containing phosphotransfer) domain-containing protein
MTTINAENTHGTVCDLNYLAEMTGMKKNLILEIIDLFLTQVPEELEVLGKAIATTDYATIKSVSHAMKSTVSVMGINILAPVLQEMQTLGDCQGDMARIRNLNLTLNGVCSQALDEIRAQKQNYL